MTHLDVLNRRLAAERVRLAAARTPQEKDLRRTYIFQLEGEIAQEEKMVELLGAHAEGHTLPTDNWLIDYDPTTGDYVA